MTELFSTSPSPELETYWRTILTTIDQNGRSAAAPQTSVSLSPLVELYGPLVKGYAGPYVIGQLGQSLDGYIATKSGASHYVTGQESLVHLHRLRALCDAVVVGWRTVAADDPQLTVRHVAGKNPLRVIIDLNGALNDDHSVFDTVDGGCLRITRPGIDDVTGIESWAVEASENEPVTQKLIEHLHKRGCKRILIEGGGQTVSRFIQDGCVDRLHLVIAPLIIGEGRRGLDFPAIPTLAKALRPKSTQIQIGKDVLFDLDLRRDGTPSA